MRLPTIKINFFTVFKLIKKLMKRKANEPMKIQNDVIISVAINDYENSENDLKGCLNDQEKILNLFKRYAPIVLSNSEATVDNVKLVLQAILNASKPGDRVVFHYSGHGTQVPDMNNEEKDGIDEALYLYDNCLVDDELFNILSQVKDGVKLLVLLDSCFSGTATKDLNIRNRSVRMFSISGKRNKAFITGKDIKWAVISACSEKTNSCRRLP